MSSKFPSKRDKPHTSKPYDRPKQNFLQKVKNRVGAAVADYLPTWLNPVAWTLGGSSNRDSSTAEGDEESEVETEDSDLAGPSGLNTEADVPRGSLQRATTAGSSSFARTPLQRNSPETQQPNLANGDDHSDNSETSASTSGCSSLAPSQEKKRTFTAAATTQLKGLQVSKKHLKQIQDQLGASPAFTGRQKSDEQPSTSRTSFSAASPQNVRIDVSIPRSTREMSRRSVAVGDDTPLEKGREKDAESSSTQTSLWSEDDERGSLMGKRSRMTRPQPVAPNKRPCFNPTAFPPPHRVSRNQSQSSTEDRSTFFSPFYPGHTSYGGASAYKKARTTAGLYNSTLRAEVMKVRQSNSQEVLSSAAQKVLNVLENMSTPLTDARKIPVEHVSTDFALSYTPSIYARRPLRIDSPMTPTLSPGPPRTSFPLQTSAPRQQRPSTILASLSQDFSPKVQEKVPSVPNTREAISEKPSGGKVRTKVSQSSRASLHNRDLDQEEPLAILDLPQVALPSIPSLPSFTFQRVQPCTSTPVVSGSSFGNKAPAPGFTFSSPIENAPPTRSTRVGSPQEKGNSFQFRSPNVKSTSPSEQPKPGSGLKAPSVTFNFAAPVSSAGSPSPLRKKPPSEVVSKASSTSKNVPELILGGSVMDILGKPAKETTPASKEPASAAAETSGFGSAFQRKSDEWVCSLCMVPNKNSDSACIACTTANPNVKSKPTVVPTNNTTTCSTTTSSSGFGSQFSVPSGSWTCSTCCINNAESAASCVACTEPKPGAAKPTLGSASAGAKTLSSTDATWQTAIAKPSGSWECDTCLVRNKEGTSRCCACETLRLNAPTTDYKDKFSGFKFGQQQAATPSSPFKFGLDSQTTGTGNEKAQVASGFKFGLPQSPAGSESKVSGGFKFGTPVSADAASIFGGQSNQSLGSSGSFKFGLSKADDKPSSESETKKLETDCVKPVTISSVAEKNVQSDVLLEKPQSGQGKFVFGQASSTENKLEVTPTLTFGQKASDATQSTNSGFSFGKTTPVTAAPVQSEKETVANGSSVQPIVSTVTTSASSVSAPSGGGFKYSFSSSQNSKQTEKEKSAEKSDSAGTTQTFSFGSAPKSQSETTVAAAAAAPSGFQFTFKGGKDSASTTTTCVPAAPAASAFTSAVPGIGTSTLVTAAPSMPVFSIGSGTVMSAPKAPASFGTALSSATPSVAVAAPAVSSTTSGSVSTGAFVFGSTKPPQATPVASAGGFNFSFGSNNNNAASKPAVAAAPFSFGLTSTSSAAPVNPASASTGFSFAATKPPASQPSGPGITQQPPTVAASPVFTFGAGNTAKPTTTVASAFGASQQPQKPVFGGVFAPNAMSSPAPLPFGQQQQQQQPPVGNVQSSEPFRFGASNAAGANASGGLFQFGAPKPAVVPAPNTNNNSGSSVFRFGSQENNPSQQQPLFGGTAQVASPGGAFTFGASSASSAPLGDVGVFPPPAADASAFVFGNVPTAVINPNPMPTPFQFQAASPVSNPFNATPTTGAGGRQIRKAIRRVPKKK